ncbi:MAG: DUF3788 domain-containing protein [Lachnospiraceae bacterium]
MTGWDKMDRASKPDNDMMSGFVRNPVWEELTGYIAETYGVEPVFEYSRCTWPGWNAKFKKGGRSLCTIYPFEGYLWVLVVIGTKEKERFEEEMPLMSEYLQNLYLETSEGMGQKWLQIVLEDSEGMDDVKRCLAIRRGRAK